MERSDLTEAVARAIMQADDGSSWALASPIYRAKYLKRAEAAIATMKGAADDWDVAWLAQRDVGTEPPAPVFRVTVSQVRDVAAILLPTTYAGFGDAVRALADRISADKPSVTATLYVVADRTEDDDVNDAPKSIVDEEEGHE